VAVKGANYFPIIVGKRPSVFGGKENVANIKAEKQASHIPAVRLLHNHHIMSFYYVLQFDLLIISVFNSCYLFFFIHI
jgi:hypothetical protein